MHPIAGAWTANIEKSKRHANHQFASATMRFDVSGAVNEIVVLRYGGVNHSGKDESAAHTMDVDGVERPIPQAPGVVAVARWAGPHKCGTPYSLCKWLVFGEIRGNSRKFGMF